jgi:hypothetical protein
MIDITEAGELPRSWRPQIKRVDGFIWQKIERDLAQQGNAIIEQLLSKEESRAIAGFYSNDELFRCRVVMERHGFGRGEYKYFAYPLPDLVNELRTAIYPHLVPITGQNWTPKKEGFFFVGDRAALLGEAIRNCGWKDWLLRRRRFPLCFYIRKV